MVRTVYSFPTVGISNSCRRIPSIASQCLYLFFMGYSFVKVMKNVGDDAHMSIENLVQIRKLVPTMTVFMKQGIYYTIS